MLRYRLNAIEDYYIYIFKGKCKSPFCSNNEEYNKKKVVICLTVKLVESIREAESQADGVIREAQQKARQGMKEAEEKAAQILKTTAADAGVQAKELLGLAEAEAQQEAAAFLKAHQKEIDAMISGARARLPEAVARITERVVKTHVDS